MAPSPKATGAPDSNTTRVTMRTIAPWVAGLMSVSFGGSPNGSSRPLTNLKISAMYCRLRSASPIGIAA